MKRFLFCPPGPLKALDLLLSLAPYVHWRLFLLREGKVETGSHSLAQPSLKLVILLSPPMECWEYSWDYRVYHHTQLGKDSFCQLFLCDSMIALLSVKRTSASPEMSTSWSITLLVLRENILVTILMRCHVVLVSHQSYLLLWWNNFRRFWSSKTWNRINDEGVKNMTKMTSQSSWGKGLLNKWQLGGHLRANSSTHTLAQKST
jgi:hypothetical protein